jgi:hypothetical protein
MALAPLAEAGWVPQFVALVSLTGLSVMRLRDLYLVSALHERAEVRRRRLRLERPE